MKIRNDMVTVVIVRPDASGQSHEVLQLHRVKDDYMGGTWQVVRGGMHAGEHAIRAALRELDEETGLVPREFYRIASVESFYTDPDDTLWHGIAFCAIVDRTSEVRLNHEHDAFRWVHRDQMLAQVMWASERQILSDLFHDILDEGPGKPYLRVKLDAYL